MRTKKYAQQLMLLSGLTICFTACLQWWQVSATSWKESAVATRINLPFVLGVDCVPALLIQPDDLERDLAVEARINEIRGLYGLQPFAKSQDITHAALRHSNDMADNDFFSHIGSDGSKAGERLGEGCYRWQSYGEIIAAGYKTPASVVEAWMGSSGHRAVILSPSFADFGAGYAYESSTKYKHYWTVDFGILAEEDLVATNDVYACTAHLKDEEGEIWLNIYSSQPCDLDGKTLH